jgi:hypothetical protein
VPANFKGELEHALDHCTVCALVAYLQAETLVYICVSDTVEVRNYQSFLLRVTADVETKTYCSDPEIKQQCSVGKTNLSMLKEIEASQDEHQEHVGDLFFLNEVTVQQGFVLFFQANQVTSISTASFLQCLKEQSAENVQNSSRTVTAWITITIHWHTLFCQNSNTWLQKAWLWSPTLTYSIWPLVISSCL